MRFNPFKITEPGGRAVYRLPLAKLLSRPLLLSLLGSGLLSRPAKSLKLIGFVLLAQNLYRLGQSLLYSRRGILEQRTRLLELAELTPALNILEIGCREGFVAIGAVRQTPGLKIVAVDDWRFGGSEENIRSNTDLEEIGGRVRVHEVNTAQLPFEAASFDRVILNGYLSHWLNEPHIVGLILREAARVLKSGGSLVISDNYQQLENYKSELAWLGLTDFKESKPARLSYPAWGCLRAHKP